MNVDAILTADWHLRDSIPLCRVDDFWEAQWRNVKFIDELQQKYNCPVLHAGDLFHHWKPSPYLLSEAIARIPDEFYTVWGNHDLPYHRMENFKKSGVFTLYRADVVDTQFGCHYGIKPKVASSMPIGSKEALIWHKFVYKSKKPFPDAKDKDEAYSILGRGDLSRFDLIVTGDNHQNFVAQRDGKLLVNPGPLTRQTIVDPMPAVYLYDSQEHEVEELKIPCDPDAVSAEHTEMAKESKKLVSAFVERLNQDWEVELSFESNMKRFHENNDIPTGVRDIVERCIDPKSCF